MDWEATVRKLMLADTSDLVELARIAGRDPKTFYVDANFRGARVTQAEREALGLAVEIKTLPKDLGPSISAIEEEIDNCVSELEAHTKEADPNIWSLLQVRLGKAYRARGVIFGDGTALNQAVEAFLAALTVQTQSAMPVRWATTTVHLADTQVDLGKVNAVRGYTREAVKNYALALAVLTEDEEPSAWTATNTKLGLALTQFISPTDLRMLEEAPDILLRVLEHLNRNEDDTEKIREAEYHVGLAHLILVRAGDRGHTARALRHLRNAVQLPRSTNAAPPEQTVLAKSQLALAELLILMAKRKADENLLQEAGDVLSDAEVIFSATEKWDLWAEARAWTAEVYRRFRNYSSALNAVEDALTIIKPGPEDKQQKYNRVVALRDRLRKGAAGDDK